MYLLRKRKIRGSFAAVVCEAIKYLTKCERRILFIGIINYRNCRFQYLQVSARAS